jgi:hypothetical protein
VRLCDAPCPLKELIDQMKTDRKRGKKSESK